MIVNECCDLKISRHFICLRSAISLLPPSSPLSTTTFSEVFAL
jgi:hypothetical protein